MRRSAWLGVLLVACLIAAGCPNACDAVKALDPTGVQSISVSPSFVQLTVGQTQQYTATVKPDRFSDDGVKWSVAPSSMATIDAKGLLTAAAPGQGVVTVTTVATPVHTAEAAVTVIAPPASK